MPLRALGAAALAALLVGCHDQNLSREEFHSRAAAVCRQAAPDIERVKTKLRSIVPPRELAPEYGELVIHVGDLAEHLEERREAPGAGRGGPAIPQPLAETLRKTRSTAAELSLEPCARAAARAARSGGER